MTAKPMAAQPIAVETTGLTKRYGELTALAPLTLQIPAGQRVSLVGANGSGKSTLLRLLAGLIEITDGEATIHGELVGSLEARAEVSFVPDDPVLYDDLSVREHLEYLGALYGAKDVAARGEALLTKLGVVHRGDDLPSGFSRGLRQKTSLAVGFLRPFSVLMVDEPFVGLDEPGRRALVELLDLAQRGGATVIVASHQLDLVSKAERIIALREGEVVHDGIGQEVDLNALVGV